MADDKAQTANTTTDSAAQSNAAKATPGSARRVIQLALICIAVMSVAIAVWWLWALKDLKRAVALYDAGKFQESSALLKDVAARPVSALRLRESAQHAMGLCLSAEASQLVEKERSKAALEKALELLTQAQALAGPTPDIVSQQREYSQAVNRIGAPTPPPQIKAIIPPANKEAPAPANPQDGPT